MTETTKPKSQYFAGYKFTRGKDPNSYYRCSKLKKRMHVFVWEYYNGPVPKGYEIHHIDLDKSNNDISNLQLLTISEHRRLHAQLLTEEQRQWKRNNLNINARPKAVEWHKSEEGRLWHKGLIKMQHETKIRKEELICSYCNKHYIGERYSKTSNTFCSTKCRSAWHKQNDVHTRICKYCGKEFTSTKRRQTCSNTCAERLRQRSYNESKSSKKN